MRRISLLLALFALQACATTDPGDGAGIAYRLPRTDVKITLAFDIKSCAPLRLEPSVTLEAVAGAQDGVYRAAGRELISALARRSTTIDVDVNGVITDLNATTTDQQAVVAGGLVKLAATIAGAGLGIVASGPPTLDCSADAVRTSERVAQLAAALEVRRAALPVAADPASVQKAIDTLAAALATAQTALHASASTTARLDGVLPSGGAPLALPDPDFEGFGALRRLIALTPRATKPLESELRRQFELVASVQDIDPTAAGAPTRRTPSPLCRASIAVPAAKRVRIVLAPRGVAYRTDKPTTLDLVASQFGPPAQVCLTTAFGENRSVGLAFDPFGRTTRLTLSADARLANAVGAAAAAAPDAATLINDVHGAGLARVRDETSQVTADNALRIARTCRAALEAGAAVCPTK